MWYLAVLSIRSLGLGLLAGLALNVFRVRSSSAKHAVWTIVTAVMLLQVVASSGLPVLPVRILAAVPEAGPGIVPHLADEFAPPLAGSPSPARTVSWRQVAIGIYATVTFVLLIRLIFSYRFTRRLVRNSRLIDELPASKVAGLRESERISVPMTVGQIAPAILLPMGWREWNPEKLRAVLAHEEAHILRADWTIGVMAAINCCIFWFHPLAWWLKRQLAVLAEYACDDLALTVVGDRQEYAQALIEIARAMKSAQGRLVVVSMAKEANVQRRMEQILDDTRTIPAAFGRRGWVTLLMCSLPVGYFASAVQLAPAQTRAAVPVAEPARAPGPSQQPNKQPVQITQTRRDTGQQVPTQAAPAPAPARAPVASPYRKWLDEEVAYIISDEERRAFNRLKAEDEYQQFITQFWLRRDPTPGTEANEMKEEHYRRIAFANDRFSVGIPGWQTDRGMIYIKHGPPDAIDSHGATSTTYPYETWTYRYLEGIGMDVELEFVDPTMTGRYHLTKDPTEKERR
jgi:GWxTD domain-containing protein